MKGCAESAAASLRAAGWDVVAQQSPLAHCGYELIGKAADGGKPVYGFSHNNMKALVFSGQVGRINK